MRFSVAVFFAAAAMSGNAAAQIDDLQASYDFLVNERAADGALLKFSISGGTYLLPSSYYDTAAYWGAYVCAGSKDTCGIDDAYNILDYQFSPAPSAAGKLQVERVNTHNGANIYDAATWQIAVMLGYVKNKLRLPSPTSAYALASGLSTFLRESGVPSEMNTAPGTRRAATTGGTFIYNGKVLSSSRAYSFRALAPEWLARDPLMGSQYAAFVTASNLPALNAAYEVGRVSWSDWKPITGENAWAFLIGPLQAAHIHYIDFLKDRFIPFDAPAVQNALDVLPTFAAMQSAVGGVYYAPTGTVGNDGDAVVNPHEISVENNFSLYAGLRLLRATLRAEQANEVWLDTDRKKKISDALQLVDVMISGGRLDTDRQTRGLLSFFKNEAWRDGAFVQGGLANDPKQGREWVLATSPLAVDVQTWGIAALGAQQIDQWFGTGASFALWQKTKNWGAYGTERTLWGVGYSDKDGNGADQSGAFRQGVLSGEWTAGAINAVRNMIRFYGADPKYTTALRQDEAAMVKAIGTLRIDRYASTDFPGKAAGYGNLISLKTKPYLYASRRYRIPFGWYANPLPSTASTAWMLMIANAYDPFGIGGTPN